MPALGEQKQVSREGERGTTARACLDVSVVHAARLQATDNVLSPTEALTSTTFVHTLAFVNCPLCVKTAASIAAGSILRATSLAGIDSISTYRGGSVNGSPSVE